MPTVMTHAAVAVGLGRIFTARRMPLLFWGIAVGLAILPDIDVLAFRYGIPYGAFLGHRGFSHSLAFAERHGEISIDRRRGQQAGDGLGPVELLLRRNRRARPPRRLHRWRTRRRFLCAF